MKYQEQSLENLSVTVWIYQNTVQRGKSWEIHKRAEETYATWWKVLTIDMCKFRKRKEGRDRSNIWKDTLWELSRTDESHPVTKEIHTMNTT